MDRYLDILEDILHFDEDSDDEWDMLLAETKREEESRSKRRNKHRGSVPGIGPFVVVELKVTKDSITIISLRIVYMMLFFEGGFGWVVLFSFEL